VTTAALAGGGVVASAVFDAAAGFSAALAEAEAFAGGFAAEVEVVVSWPLSRSGSGDA